MKHSELIDRLGKEGPQRRLSPTTTLLFATAVAAIIVILFSILWLKPRGDFSDVGHNFVFGLKLVFVSSVTAGALAIVCDLSVPGRQPRWTFALAALPFILIMILGLRELAAMPSSHWTHHVGDASWQQCLWQIPVLSIPALAIIAMGMRHLAPTNLRRAGAYTGLLAGGIGAIGYALHCSDDTLAFVAFAYTLPIIGMVALGAFLGPKLLRWA